MNEPVRYRAGRLLAGAAGLVAATLLLGACATAAVAPTSALDAARVAIVNAEKMDASHYAGAELDAARQKLQRAERAAKADDDEQENMVLAERYAQQARIEAELAMARTESRKAAEINDDLIRSAEALEAEMNRPGASR